MDETLKYHDYKKGELQLLKDLQRLCQDHTLSDVVFVTGTERARIFAHSSLVAARCSKLSQDVANFLAKYPNNICSEPDQRETLLFACCEISTPVACDIMTFLYTGRIRLHSDTVFTVLYGALKFGIANLAALAEEHVYQTINPQHALHYLTLAMNFGFANIEAFALNYIAIHAATIIARDEFCSASVEVASQIVKQDNLNASEEDIWCALVRLASYQASVPVNLKISEMNSAQKNDVKPYLAQYLRAGYVRILNMTATWFVEEVEPLGLLDDEELLLKYRFDATSDLEPFEHSFPYNRIDFLTRIRHRTLSFESASHPHAQGVTTMTQVSLPLWTRYVDIDFDKRCDLGRYSDLSFYEDSDCTLRVASLNSVFASYRAVSRHECQVNMNMTKPSIRLSCRQFWFKFYSPRNFRPSWGYCFQVKPALV